jgi:hypothetical protein
LLEAKAFTLKQMLMLIANAWKHLLIFINITHYIDSFKESYLSLNISVTSKLHAVFFLYCGVLQQNAARFDVFQ